MTLSSYPSTITIETGQNIIFSVIMPAPVWSSPYDNLGKVRVVLNDIEIGSSGERSLPGGGSPINIDFVIPNTISVGTYNLVLVTELRYEYNWRNAGNYNVTLIVNQGSILPGNSNIIIIVVAMIILYYFFIMRGK